MTDISLIDIPSNLRGSAAVELSSSSDIADTEIHTMVKGGRTI
jgi:hypothetical protein